MNQIIQTLIQLVKERHTQPWSVDFSFTYDSEAQDDKYFCIIKGGIPETDNVMMYRGTGMSFDDAFEAMRLNVILDNRYGD